MKETLNAYSPANGYLNNFLCLLYTRTNEALSIREGDSKSVQSCKFLNTVEGSSSWGGLAMQEVGIENAKTELLEKAAIVGATHIVYLNINKNFSGASIAANAYSCL